MSFNQLKVEDIKKIYTKIYENACELIDEAELLLEHQKYARAYLCAHISIEEFGKLPMLYTVAINVHNGDKVDWKALSKRLRDHKEKTSSSYSIQMLMDKVLFDFKYDKYDKYDKYEEKVNSMNDAEKEKYYDLENFKSFLNSIDLPKLKPDSLSHALLSHSQEEEFMYRKALADLLNEYKNHSLYADFNKEEFLKPSEVIDKNRCIRRIMFALFQKKFTDFLNPPNGGYKLFKYEDVGFYDLIAQIKGNLSEK